MLNQSKTSPLEDMNKGLENKSISKTRTLSLTLLDFMSLQEVVHVQYYIMCLTLYPGSQPSAQQGTCPWTQQVIMEGLLWHDSGLC